MNKAVERTTGNRKRTVSRVTKNPDARLLKLQAKLFAMIEAEEALWAEVRRLRLAVAPMRKRLEKKADKSVPAWPGLIERALARTVAGRKEHAAYRRANQSSTRIYRLCGKILAMKAHTNEGLGALALALARDSRTGIMGVRDSYHYEPRPTSLFLLQLLAATKTQVPLGLRRSLKNCEH